MLNDWSRSPFGGRSNRSFSLSNNTRLFFSVLRPGGLLPFLANFFAPRAPWFFNRALSPCVFRLSPCRSYRRFVSPRRPTCPRSAACRSFPDATPYCFANSPSAFQRGRPLTPSARMSISPPLLLNDYLARLFRPRTGTPLKQKKSLRCSISSTAP